jgi:hypothetical protein
LTSAETPRSLGQTFYDRLLTEAGFSTFVETVCVSLRCCSDSLPPHEFLLFANHEKVPDQAV